jgi:hypothetical protein
MYVCSLPRNMKTLDHSPVAHAGIFRRFSVFYFLACTLFALYRFYANSYIDTGTAAIIFGIAILWLCSTASSANQYEPLSSEVIKYYWLRVTAIDLLVQIAIMATYFERDVFNMGGALYFVFASAVIVHSGVLLILLRQAHRIFPLFSRREA